MRIHLLARLQYRLNTIVSVLFTNLDLVAFLVFWFAAFQGREHLRGYSLPEMITYFVVVRFASCYLLHDVSIELGQNIKSGALSDQLLSPNSVLLSYYAKTVARRIPSLLSFVFCAAFLSLGLGEYFTWQSSPWRMAVFLLSIAVGSLSSFLIGVLIGTLSFWMTESFAVLWSLLVLINFLSGRWIPLDLLPAWLEGMVSFLPFAVFGYLPTKTYIGHHGCNAALLAIGIQLLWCLLEFAAVHLLWTNGIRRYEAVGIWAKGRRR